MNTIKLLIYEKKWDLLITKYSPKEICLSLTFSEAMKLVKDLFYTDIQNDRNQQFALKLAFEIENYFKEDWEKDWKNDILLGDMCSILWLYQEQYIFYKRAYDKLSDPPAALLLLLAECLNAPDNSPITEEEAETYLKRSADKKITFETALMMRTFFEEKGDSSQVEYWNQIYEKLKKENIHAELLVPDVFKE